VGLPRRSSWIGVAALGLVAAVVVLPAGSAQAAITVTSTDDAGPGTLRQAIADAAPGETVVVPAGIYTLTSDQLTIAKSLTISGHSAADTFIQADGSFRIFHVAGAGNSVTIDGVTIRHGLISAPGAQALGGGVLSEGAELTLRDVVVADNRADASGAAGQPGGQAAGGGILSIGGTLRLLDSKVVDNGAVAVAGIGSHGGNAAGGGVLSTGAFLIDRSTIAANRADAQGGQGDSNPIQEGGNVSGGGILAENLSPPDASLIDSSIDRNLSDASGGPGASAGTAAGGGAVLVSVASDVAITNVTIAGNIAQVLGGGNGTGGGLFAITDGAPLTLANATVSSNAIAGTSSGTGGDFFTDPTSPALIVNTIISNGSGPAGSENCGGGGVSQGFNLDSLDQCAFHSVGDRVNRDPLLGPLGDNGGPTLTMAPAANSPAVDQATPFGVRTDQRGVQRPIDLASIPNPAGGDGSDIGALELQPSTGAPPGPGPEPSAGAPPGPGRASSLAIRKLKRNRRRGTVVLLVTVPLPAAGTIALSGNRIKPVSMPVPDTGSVRLPVIGDRGVRRALRLHGRRRVTVSVTYTPTGDDPVIKTMRVILVKSHAPKPPCTSRCGTG
jgi:hypothetical protein